MGFWKGKRKRKRKGKRKGKGEGEARSLANTFVKWTSLSSAFMGMDEIVETIKLNHMPNYYTSFSPSLFPFPLPLPPKCVYLQCLKQGELPVPAAQTVAVDMCVCFFFCVFTGNCCKRGRDFWSWKRIEKSVEPARPCIWAIGLNTFAKIGKGGIFALRKGLSVFALREGLGPFSFSYY